MITTRGRYALRVMIDLAQNVDNGYVAMKEIAARQGISKKYMEQIMPSLVKNGLVEGVHGKGGGYKLTRTPPMNIRQGRFCALPRVNLRRLRVFHAMPRNVREKTNAKLCLCGKSTMPSQTSFSIR